MIQCVLAIVACCLHSESHVIVLQACGRIRRQSNAVKCTSHQWQQQICCKVICYSWDCNSFFTGSASEQTANEVKAQAACDVLATVYELMVCDFVVAEPQSRGDPDDARICAGFCSLKIIDISVAGFMYFKLCS